MAVLVTKEAPDFTATALMPDGSFKSDFKLSGLRGQKVVLFFYPLDFTFVCPSELLAFHDLGRARLARLDAAQAGQPAVRAHEGSVTRVEESDNRPAPKP